MTISKIYLAYMALVGVASGALLTVAPRAGDVFIKPYFWILIAVGLFDGALFLLGHGAPAQALRMTVRIAGFVLGALVMVAIVTWSGSPAALF
jgi:hypothetical protein